MRHRVVAIWLLAGAAGPALLSPQELQQPAPREIFLDAVEVEVVNIEVFVSDRKGRPVQGLTREDFQLLIDGRPVTLDYFYSPYPAEPRPGEGPAARPEAPIGEAAAGPSEPIRSATQQLHLVVFVDTLNLHPSHRRRVFRRLREFVADRLGPKDRVLLASHNRSLRVVQTFTGDAALIVRGLDQLESEAGAFASREAERRAMLREIEISTSSEGLRERIYEYSKWVLNDVRSTLVALEQVVASLGGVGGRKAVLVVTDGLALLPGEDLYHALRAKFGDVKALMTMRGFSTNHLVEAVYRQANANRVILYTVDAAGIRAPATSAVEIEEVGDSTPLDLADSVFSTNQQGSLILLADETGGRAILGANDIGRDLERLTEDFSSYYSLGYRPEEADSSKPHTVEVKVGRKGIDVRHRSSFQGRTPAARLAGSTSACLVFGFEENSLGARVETTSGEPVDGIRPVSVAVSLPIANLALIPGETTHEGRLRLVLSALDAQGGVAEAEERQIPIRAPAEDLERALEQSFSYRWSFELPAGEHTFAVGVWDEIAARGSFLRTSVE